MITNLVKPGKMFVRNTAQLRKKSGLTFKEMASISEVSVSSLVRIERARKARTSYNPMLKTVLRLSKVSNVTVSDYLTTKLTFQ